jgi:hypothetical protein
MSSHAWLVAKIAINACERHYNQVIDAVPSYIVRIQDIATPVYLPTIEDILELRVRAAGIVEEKFLIGGKVFVIVDVSGQRNEKKKWMHYFAEFDAVIFVAALNNYDQTLFGDETTNQMVRLTGHEPCVESMLYVWEGRGN